MLSSINAPLLTQAASLRTLLWSFICLALMSPVVIAADAWTLSASPAESSDGVFRLHWSGPASEVTLEQARSADFDDARRIYQGTDRATLISGQTNGRYHFRLLNTAGQALAETTVQVSHHALSRAWGFFAVGLLVFLATIALVVRGAKDTE